MYDYRPQRQSPKAKILSFGLLCAAILLFFLSAKMERFAFIPQCVGLALLLPMIQIVARYVILQYLYRLRPYEDGNVDFEVYSYRGGSRMQLVCRIGLEEITDVRPMGAAKGEKKPRYNYHPDMAPKTGVLVSVRNADGECELLLAPDAHLFEMLDNAARQNKAADTFEEETHD